MGNICLKTTTINDEFTISYYVKRHGGEYRIKYNLYAKDYYDKQFNTVLDYIKSQDCDLENIKNIYINNKIIYEKTANGDIKEYFIINNKTIGKFIEENPKKLVLNYIDISID